MVGNAFLWTSPACEKASACRQCFAERTDSNDSHSGTTACSSWMVAVPTRLSGPFSALERPGRNLTPRERDKGQPGRNAKLRQRGGAGRKA